MSRSWKILDARHGAGRAVRIWIRAISLREETREVRLRARLVIGSLVLGTIGVAALLAVLLVTGANGLISQGAEQRAQHSLRLLTTVGADMPDLTPASVARGLSPVSDAELDAAVQRGQRQGLLSALSIWNGRGQVIYSLDGGGAAWMTSKTMRNELAIVLHGRELTHVNASELDLTTHRRTGTFEAFQPLRDARGHVYAALEIDLPLQPILSQTGQEGRDILIFVIAGLAALWLIFLPLASRVTVDVSRSWTPGRRRLLNDFRRALDQDEIELLYQPQVWTSDGNVHGFEALVRWRRGGKLQGPDQFLPVVEGSVLMRPLSDRVIELATSQLADWRRDGYTPRVSINLSARDLEDLTLASRIRAALTRHAVPSDQLTVEVTETAILFDVECARRVLSEISELGVQIAVDDFGTGHASISRLHQFPIDEVKIDRSFVTPTDERTRAYLRAIIRFTESLGLRVVAEGVEDEQTLSFLRDLGCDLAQGYAIARPLPAGQIQDWLSAKLPTPSSSPTISLV